MPAPSNFSPDRPSFRLDTDRLDQHLTTSRAVIGSLIGAAEVQGTDTVLDIGAGTGLLTQVIAARAGATIAVEIDRRFEPYLQPLHGTNGITVCWADFRKFTPPPQTTAVVANPPFAAAEHLVDWLLRIPSLRRVALIVGRRFARAATAAPGATSYTRLSLHLQASYVAQTRATVGPTDFFPAARTPAAILTLTPTIVSPLLQALDAAVTANAGTQLQELLTTLHGNGLLHNQLPVLRERLRPLLHRRLQQLTNQQISHTTRALLQAEQSS